MKKRDKEGWKISSVKKKDNEIEKKDTDNMNNTIENITADNIIEENITMTNMKDN